MPNLITGEEYYVPDLGNCKLKEVKLGGWKVFEKDGIERKKKIRWNLLIPLSYHGDDKDSEDSNKVLEKSYDKYIYENAEVNKEELNELIHDDIGIQDILLPRSQLESMDDPQNELKFTVLFVRRDSEPFEMLLSPNTKILQIKNEICAKLGSQPDKLRLIFRGKELANDNTVSDYNINNDSYVILEFKEAPHMTLRNGKETFKYNNKVLMNEIITKLVLYHACDKNKNILVLDAETLETFKFLISHPDIKGKIYIPNPFIELNTENLFPPFQNRIEFRKVSALYQMKNGIKLDFVYLDFCSTLKGNKKNPDLSPEKTLEYGFKNHVFSNNCSIIVTVSHRQPGGKSNANDVLDKIKKLASENNYGPVSIIKLRKSDHFHSMVVIGVRLGSSKDIDLSFYKMNPNHFLKSEMIEIANKYQINCTTMTKSQIVQSIMAKSDEIFEREILGLGDKNNR